LLPHLLSGCDDPAMISVEQKWPTNTGPYISTNNIARGMVCGLQVRF
jgi:hypothetical protein